MSEVTGTARFSHATPWGLPRSDLEHSMECAADDLDRLRGARVLITGGTGFLGSWLVATLVHANRRLGLGLRLAVVTRRARPLPIDDGPDLETVRGDVSALPRLGSFDHVVHGATPSLANGDDPTPAAIDAAVVTGTEQLLAAAAEGTRFLLLSTGAVYGPRTAPVDEGAGTEVGAGESETAYARAKRRAEQLCSEATRSGAVEAVAARLFAFIGPRIPLDQSFAAGGFLGDVLADRPVELRSDGLSLRSYLYAADLPEWCWALLVRGVPGSAYNVGSPDAVTIVELAERIAALGGRPGPIMASSVPPSPRSDCYVPITARAEHELGLHPRTDLDSAIERSLDWFRNTEGSAGVS